VLGKRLPMLTPVAKELRVGPDVIDTDADP
jgi:hypothetical protein